MTTAHTRSHTHPRLTVAQTAIAIANIRAVQAQGETGRGDESISEPVVVIAAADEDWFADRACEREQRWRDGAA